MLSRCRHVCTTSQGHVPICAKVLHRDCAKKCQQQPLVRTFSTRRQVYIYIYTTHVYIHETYIGTRYALILALVFSGETCYIHMIHHAILPFHHLFNEEPAILSTKVISWLTKNRHLPSSSVEKSSSSAGLCHLGVSTFA